ncbi:prolipoprotein diacylglyceryl transferase family protein [Neisseria wadsworthii]|uniref:prolipoprotein diacylglyceryl transferase family protein n=1 Tax=Neisseria wadsworthii TaxID=607711 RepID=UPI000D313A14|nr:prolipoprotein diacylglyceryl transferase family protein [Neisseria wadsworthii]
MPLILRKILYAAVFCLLLPVLLWQWAVHADNAVTLPLPGAQWPGGFIAAGGIALMLWAMIGLWRTGKGLPMNAFPPEEYVFSGAYRVCRHPIYTGAVLLCLGLSWLNGSSAGVWLVTPLFALMIVAYIYGFEREIIERQFGAKPLLHKTWLDLPPPNGRKPGLSEKSRAALLVFVPWLLGYEIFVWLGLPSDMFYSNTAADAYVPILPFTVLFYLLAYPLTIAVPFIIDSNQRLRAWMSDAFWGMLLIFYGYLVVPAAINYQTLPDSLFSNMIEWGRQYDSPMASFPSFHIFWALIAAYYFAGTPMPYRRYLVAASWLVILSCLTTHNHTLADAAAAVSVYCLVRYRKSVYMGLLHFCERIANSWREWQFGKVRLINHGFYAALGGFFGFLIMAYLLPGNLWAVYLMGLSGFIGAGLWAQWVEGSAALLRPFGYYGSVIGILTAVFTAGLFGTDIWSLLAAAALAACPIQFFGRCRCLVQGCCHGKPTDTVQGLRFTHPKSRVNKLAGLCGQNLYPTQFYSMAANFLSFFLLWRLYTLEMPASFVTGIYFILSGIFRFVEESLRGEPQTPYFMGMRVYQWLAIASILLGIVMTYIPSIPLKAGNLNTSLWIQAFLYALLIWFVYGVDFPYSNRRFSRLT